MKANESLNAEIKKFYAEYVPTFVSEDVEALATNCMVAPIYLSNENGTVLLHDRSEVVDWLSAYFSGLASQDYARSEVLGLNIWLLTDTSAVLSTGLRRFDEKDNMILEAGASYSVAKIAGSWRFTMMWTHDVANIIS